MPKQEIMTMYPARAGNHSYQFKTSLKMRKHAPKGVTKPNNNNAGFSLCTVKNTLRGCHNNCSFATAASWQRTNIFCTSTGCTPTAKRRVSKLHDTNNVIFQQQLSRGRKGLNKIRRFHITPPLAVTVVRKRHTCRMS